MSGPTLRILDQFRALPPEEQQHLAAIIMAELRPAHGAEQVAERLRLLDEVTASYRSESPRPDNLDDAWADAILTSKRTV